ncbi:MAG: ATP-dependent helicase [Bacteroidetes bacterium]|nr:ATP-dependent helicase [Bacteroidota bacterium]
MKKYTLQSHRSSPLQLVQPEHLRIDYQKDLNDAQYEAATSVEGPHLIIAGAGTGKTRTIVYRVAYLVELGVKPGSILLLTFTRKAAQEMLRKASLLLDSRCEEVSGGTFHSFANSVLRRYGQLLGYTSNYSILDQTDAEDVVNLLRTKMKLDVREKRFPRKETLYDLYSKSLNTLVPVSQLLAQEYPQFIEQEKEILALHQAYAQYKKEHNLMDYDDLLYNFATLLREHPEVQRVLEERYRYVMVDEYQDTNRVQAEIVKLLAVHHQNIMVVGDDAQCIYSFRGSTIRNILTFHEDFPNCKVIKLEENYRSAQPILNLANAILNREDITTPAKSEE